MSSDYSSQVLLRCVTYKEAKIEDELLKLFTDFDPFMTSKKAMSKIKIPTHEKIR